MQRQDRGDAGSTCMRYMGEQQRLRDIRTMFQHAAEDKFRAAVEHATARSVISFMSAVDVERDLAAEIFILEPDTTLRRTSGLHFLRRYNDHGRLAEEWVQTDDRSFRSARGVWEGRKLGRGSGSGSRVPPSPR
jgi:hypothetical protein